MKRVTDTNQRTMKRVTDPLDDRVKAQIVSHRAQVAEDDDDLSSSSFSEILFDFPEHEAGDYSGSDSDLPPCNSDGELEDEVETINCGEDSFRNVLASRVSEAVELLSSCLNSSKSPEILRRHVMAYLRDFGYNAGVCKAKWERSDGITAGDHEFIDVLRSDSQNRIQRYIVDLEFSSEFEIARPTNHFQYLIRSLPKVFVGKSEELKKIVKVMSKAAKRSFKSRGLHLPPWRKQRFMENKWFGSYRRSTNFRPASMELLAPLDQALAVKCRSVGFDDAVNRRLLFPVVTRTR
ncbi:PREDICTED: uncharacterized protein LOC109182636 [Ipomoea nil]|uniref:uncharacterized protein LOC109182636 n=1 Tax=Ipomoea nil TaxID=35883 RepID=UPI000901DA99|nr:PREDICTED: uncharacterized protein LOC109182636 [Ipomoea nil]